METSKKGIVLIVLVFSLVMLSGCKSDDVANENITLTFLTSPWPPDAINYLAKEKGFFDKHGVNVELLWADGYEDTFSQVEDGTLHVWNTTLLDALTYHYETGVGQAILVEDFSAGADAVVTLPDTAIDSIAGLSGKTVGVERGTVGEFFLNILLTREDLTLDDLNIKDVASENILSALQSGEIDAGICYEPCPNDTLNAGGLILVDSAKERDVIVDVYVANKEHVDRYKDHYVRAIKAIIEAGEYFKDNPDESAEIMSEVLNMPKEDVLSAFEGLRIPTFRDNQAAFNRASGFTSLYNLARLASQYLEEQGIIDEGFEIDTVINSELLEALN